MYRSLIEIFAENVRFLRKKKGLTQEELANIAGIHRTYIGMIERGEKNITLNNMEKIAKALEVDLTLLLKK